MNVTVTRPELARHHPVRVMCRTSQTAIFGHVTERYGVIIVGSGAGGGTLAHTLAPSGKRILLLERGNFLPREIENWDLRLQRIMWRPRSRAEQPEARSALAVSGPSAVGSG